ncbi:MAG: HTH domain-containing protein [Chloroflexi bacterium]|nr:HTH domain-containing protein [Chloroflexota bacterium]
MNSLDAAFEVLLAAGPRGLNCRAKNHELTDLMISQDFWQTRGKTPWATVAKDIQADIRQYSEASRFRQLAPGVFAAEAGHRESLPEVPGRHAEAGRTAAATRAAGSMSFADAAEQVLRQSSSKEPMHYEDITGKAIKQELIQPEGKTPAISLNAIIGTEIRRREARGEPPRFVRHGRGLIGLAEALPPGVAAQVEMHNNEVRAALLERAIKGTSREFEKLLATLLAEMGFDDVEVTPSTRDGGFDVHGTLVVDNLARVKMAGEAKRWTTQKVSVNVVRELRGTLVKRKVGHGLIVATSDFTDSAKKEAPNETYPIELVNGEEFANLLAEYGIGVEREETTLLRLEEPIQ